MKITEPGIYDMPSDEYHADPTPEPSLSAGMINQLLVAPAKCYEASRRLNQNYEEPDGQEKFTIGTVSHVIFLEPHQFEERVIVVEYDDWRKEVAKLTRARAREIGKTAILAKHMDQVRAAREKFLANPFVAQAFDGGAVEQSLFWRHPIFGFWCRARPDFIKQPVVTHMNDYKATDNANPEQFGRHAYGLGYHRRAAWYLEGAQVLFGERPAHYWFCNQETKPPYLTSVVELDWAALEAGQAENDHAAGIFAHCLHTGDWYGYRERGHLNADRAFRVSLPNYALFEIDARLGRGAATPPPMRTGVPAEFDMEGVE